MNKQQLANKIWESANKMRSKIEANEYKDYILGFIFYKFLSDSELKFLREHDYNPADYPSLTEENKSHMNYIRNNIGYFIAYKDLFSTWLGKGNDFDVSDVTDALSAFTRLIHPTYKKVFDKIFDTLETGLTKLGENNASRTKAISDLIHLIKDIPMDGKQDYDVLGYIYEYLIGQFASNAGKKAGEFYTPHEVSLLMSEIIAWHLRERSEIKIYDPTSGSGSLLINIGRSVAKHINDENKIKYYAQELKQNTYNLTRMNLVMRGIIPANIEVRNGDTLERDWPWFDEGDPDNTYDPLYVDAVVSNPPYSQQWDPSGKAHDPRYSRFGLAPKSKADYAFLLHDLYHLKPDGVMTIVLPHGVLFRGGEEGEIRKNLIEYNHVDAVIGLPANIFFGTGIPTIIMVLRQRRENDDVLIIDASKGFVKVGKNNQLRASDIKRIADTYISREDVPKYSRKISREEIRQNDYNLNIPRYVDSSEAAETWDIYASMFGGIPRSEIDLLDASWNIFPGLRESIFSDDGSPYVALKTDDPVGTIRNNAEVQAYLNQFSDAFADVPGCLEQKLIDQCASLRIPAVEAEIASLLFEKLEHFSLIDRYEAYQILDDNWAKIAVDLEIIQTEGFEAVRKYDPNMVVKKKDGKETEAQDGWVGHVLPFSLVQSALLGPKLNEIRVLEDRLSEIGAEYDELLENLSEEDKSGDCFNDEGGFVAAAVAKAAKTYKAEMKKGTVYGEDDLEKVVMKAADLMAEEKTVKKEIKNAQDELDKTTRSTLESLTDEQARELLRLKWITPLMDSLLELPKDQVKKLVEKVKALSSKYEVTLAGVEDDIRDTERELAGMLDMLTGNEYDMKGLMEFKELLGGGKDD